MKPRRTLRQPPPPPDRAALSCAAQSCTPGYPSSCVLTSHQTGYNAESGPHAHRRGECGWRKGVCSGVSERSDFLQARPTCKRAPPRVPMGSTQPPGHSHSPFICPENAWRKKSTHSHTPHREGRLCTSAMTHGLTCEKLKRRPRGTDSAPSAPPPARPPTLQSSRPASGPAP